MDTALVISGAAIIGTLLILLFGATVAVGGWRTALIVWGFALTIDIVSLAGALLIHAGVS